MCVMLLQLLLAHLSCLMQDTALPATGTIRHPSLGLPADFLSVDHDQGSSRPLLFSLTAVHSKKCPAEKRVPRASRTTLNGPGSPDSRALLPCHSQLQGATVELEYFTWLFFFFPTCTRSRDGLVCVEPLESSKALSVVRALLSPWPFQQRAVGKQEAQLQDKEQKSQGNVTSVVISTHAKVPSAFFFFPFEISNSSLWTKSCLSENIDLRPLTKLHFKQSRGLLFPLPTDLSAHSLDLPGSC